MLIFALLENSNSEIHDECSEPVTKEFNPYAGGGY